MLVQPAYRLVIANKNTSSWSIRPWLVMTRMGLSFDETNIDLTAPDAKTQLAAHSPTGFVLVVGGLAIWESLAIMDYLADSYPDAGLWPHDSDARATARSVCAEMHAGFFALRKHCPMDFLGRTPMAQLPDDVSDDVRRIIAIWQMCRTRHGRGGPFLFGEFSVADAMYAPVASRFRSYLTDLTPYGDNGIAASYVDTIFALPEVEAWGDEARAELAP